jgi:hypothetical protein
MIQICTIASWLAYLNLIIGLFGGVYCGVYHMFLIFLPPLTVGPQMLRGVTLWGMLQHNKYMLQHGESVYFGRARILRSTSMLEANCEGGNASPAQSTNDDEEKNWRSTTITTTAVNDDDNQQLSPKEKAIRVRRKMKRIVKICKLFLIILPIILIIVMIAGTDKDFLLETNFQSCFPEPYLVLSIGRGFDAYFHSS